MGTLIEFREVCKYYQMGDTTVKAADHISFQTVSYTHLTLPTIA